MLAPMSTSNSPDSKKLIFKFCNDEGSATLGNLVYVTIKPILHNAIFDVDLSSCKCLVLGKFHNKLLWVLHFKAHQDNKVLAHEFMWIL